MYQHRLLEVLYIHPFNVDDTHEQHCKADLRLWMSGTASVQLPPMGNGAWLSIAQTVCTAN